MQKSAQFSMMSSARMRLCRGTTFNKVTRHFGKFVQCFMNLGANMIKHASDMELYDFTYFRKVFRLESDSFNHEISANEMVVGAQPSPIVHECR